MQQSSTSLDRHLNSSFLTNNNNGANDGGARFGQQSSFIGLLNQTTQSINTSGLAGKPQDGNNGEGSTPMNKHYLNVPGSSSYNQTGNLHNRIERAFSNPPMSNQMITSTP